MILVLLGTQNNSFERLLNKINECIEKNIITDHVIVQAGHTKFTSNKMEIFDFIPLAKMNTLLNEADLIITHGGVGSITSALKLGKKVIAVSRSKEFNEHVNNHQIQIIDAFDANGYLKGTHNVDDIEEILKNISSFKPTKFISNTGNILNIVSEFIDNN